MNDFSYDSVYETGLQVLLFDVKGVKDEFSAVQC